MNMKKVVSYLVISCVLGVMSFSPRLGSTTGTVQASPAMAFITGTVMDEAGKPLAGALVALLSSQPGSLQAKNVKSVKTDNEGRFTAGAAPGTYRLRAEAEGFRPKFTTVKLGTASQITHNFSLKRVGTLIEQRGDREDYRWIGRSVPRNVLHYDNPDDIAENKARPVDTDGDGLIDDAGRASDHADFHRSFHGTVQFLGTVTSARGNLPNTNFYGMNFAVSGSLSD
ncbi:MAG TPA: carboxypeptidase-like regulatory domain-containing protein, partial [Blastocatellia bacterium]|nr:carboxypeptidase-like regulatory domain-containing protein [Blastocatellia bacterium]